MTTAEPTPPPAYLTSRDVMARYGVSLRTVRTWTAGGHLPAPERVGPKLLRWSAAELDAWDSAGRPRRSDWESSKPNRRRK